MIEQHSPHDLSLAPSEIKKTVNATKDHGLRGLISLLARKLHIAKQHPHPDRTPSDEALRDIVRPAQGLFGLNLEYQRTRVKGLDLSQDAPREPTTQDYSLAGFLERGTKDRERTIATHAESVRRQVARDYHMFQDDFNPQDDQLRYPSQVSGGPPQIHVKGEYGITGGWSLIPNIKNGSRDYGTISGMRGSFMFHKSAKPKEYVSAFVLGKGGERIEVTIRNSKGKEKTYHLRDAKTPEKFDILNNALLEISNTLRLRENAALTH